VTKILSNGFHSPAGGLNSGDGGAGSLVGRRGGHAKMAVGACGVNTPSSRSLSYTTMVPSACDTRKRFGDDGTHRTAVQAELEIRPCDYASISYIPGQPLADGLTCLFSRPYLSAIGSAV
jgi:hypothetical protein